MGDTGHLHFSDFSLESKLLGMCSSDAGTSTDNGILSILAKFTGESIPIIRKLVMCGSETAVPIRRVEEC